MNVLIIGGAGYIGSASVEYFLNHGHRVVVYDNLSEGHRSAVDPRATFVLGDILDRSTLIQTLQAHQIEAVVHFAAFALVGESMKVPGKYFRNNTVGTQNVLDACVECHVRKFVFSSTCATYGAPQSPTLSESHPQKPVNPYGESKLLVERMLPWYQQIHGLEYVALRYFNAAGATPKVGEHHRIETHIIPNLLAVALKQKPGCEIYGNDYPTPDGTCIRDYIHVTDLAQAHLQALAPKLNGFFNLGNGSGYSVLQVLQACERITGSKIPFNMKDRRPGDPAALVASAALAQETLGWRPQFPKLEQIVQTAWDWHQAHPHGYPD